MGLLDAFLNTTPEQNRSLMAASAKMLELSGPSRTPRSFGQIAGAAYGTFNDTMDEQQQRAALQRQQAMTEQILGWKAKDAEADYGAQQGGREREARIAKRLAGMFGGGADAGGGDPGHGLPNGSPQMSQMTTLTRHGMTPGQAAAIAFGGGGAQGQQGMPDVGSQEWMQGIQQQAGMAPGGMARPGPGAGPMGGQPAPAPGQPDWFAMGMPPQMALGMQQGKKVNRTQQMVDNMMTKAQIQFEEGDQAGLDKTLDQIQKFRPDATWKEVMENGRAVNKAFFNDGTEGDASSAEVAKGLEFRDAGDSIVGLNHFNGREESRLRKGQSPDSAATDVRFANRRLGGGGSGGGGGGGDASLDDETLDMMADQALRGDRSVFTNIGRGAQGSVNLVRLRSRITQKAKERGVTGADLASITADYGGQQAGLRTSGNISARIENAAAEAAELAPLAIDASRNVARSGFLPFGKMEVMFNVKTNDPALNKFATANIGLATAYANAMARGQKATVSDMQEARELLSTAKDQPAYEAIVGQMKLEIRAAQRAPQTVRNHLRNEISGRGNDHGGEGAGGPPAAKPVITLNDIAATARSSGRSTREVTAAFRAKGFKIQGDK